MFHLRSPRIAHVTWICNYRWQTAPESVCVCVCAAWKSVSLAKVAGLVWSITSLPAMVWWPPVHKGVHSWIEGMYVRTGPTRARMFSRDVSCTLNSHNTRALFRRSLQEWEILHTSTYTRRYISLASLGMVMNGTRPGGPFWFNARRKIRRDETAAAFWGKLAHRDHYWSLAGRKLLVRR